MTEAIDASGLHSAIFVIFEGMDGCGKSTQLRHLARRLRAHGRIVCETAEPGGTVMGRKIRGILLDAANRDLTPTAELLLYVAARAQSIEEQILPALARGEIVLADRFTDSTLAYQGAGRGLGADVVLMLDQVACRSVTPDLTLLLDMDFGTSVRRARERNDTARSSETRLDDESLDFHRRVYESYHSLAARAPDRVHIIDATNSAASVHEAIWSVLTQGPGALLREARSANASESLLDTQPR